MRVVLFAMLVGCGYHPDPAVPPGGDGAVDEPISNEMPVECTPWNIQVTNFDPCMLPAAGTFSGALINTDVPGNLPAMELAQQNGPTILVVHLESLDLGTGLVVLGSKPLLLAVEGNVTIGAPGLITVGAGNDDATICATLGGADGNGSNDAAAGGGGGGGGAGVGSGIAGSDGDRGAGAPANSEGPGGAGNTGTPSTLVPLHGGCSGGAGGKHNNTGTPGNGGPGGGGLQISSNGMIDVAGKIDASGRGAEGAPTAQTGGGGGGGGGAIVLEAAMIHVSGTLCADGGSGANGGGSSADGIAGQASPCNGTAGALGGDLNNNGAEGGDGGFRNSLDGGAPGNAAGGAGGGGGGGGAGWIRITGTLTTGAAAVITPGQ